MHWVNPVTGLNLTSIFITNFFGVILMIALLFSRGWIVRVKKHEGNLVLLMIISVLAGCFIEPLSFVCEGLPGNGIHYCLFFLNTILFSLDVIIGPCYAAILTSHINKKLSRIQIYVILTLIVIEMIMLFINFFNPIIFEISSDNIYERKSLFWMYIVIEAGLMAYGLFVFLLAKLRGRILRFFPAWQFLVPILLGTLIQGFTYGVSVIWPSIGIAVCSIVLCLQNENIFIDKLTGVYNRYFLDEIKKDFKSKSKGTIGSMMLDMNGFKSINDLYSHEEGDIALKSVAKILKDVISSNGSIIRFAGDEFVIIIKTSSEAELLSYKENILKSFDEFNKTSGKPYTLSAAIGTSLYDFSKGDVSDFLNNIDSLMYIDKENYYKNHDRRSASRNS